MVVEEAGSRQWAAGRDGAGLHVPLAYSSATHRPLPTAHFFPLASPSQEDVFRSISENVRESDSNGQALPVLFLIGAAVLMLMVLFSSRRKREVTPKPLNHAGKLLKELARLVPLRPAEVKQLKLLAEAGAARATEADGDGNVSGDGRSAAENPLVFVLCPSLLVKAMRAKPPKVDRRVIAGLARKLGIGRL